MSKTLKNTENTYGSVSKGLHWIIFLLVLMMLIIGFIMDDLPEKFQGAAYMLHKSTGLLILALMIFRFIWRQINIVPSLSNMPTWQKILAQLVHQLFYVVLIIIPLTGWILSTASGHPPTFYDIVTLPFPGIPLDHALAEQLGTVHTFLAYALLTLLGGHILASLKHHYIDKDDILKRMV